MVKYSGFLAIVAIVSAAASMPGTPARAQQRQIPGHDGFGTRHAQRHSHDGWRFVVPQFGRHYGSYYFDGGINYYVPRTDVRDTRHSPEPVRIDFGGYRHVDDLAGRLERLANELCLDLHYNYRHNRGFTATYREAYQILATAKYIHAKEHQGDRAEVARRLNEVDGLFHHVQEDVGRWRPRPTRQIGQGNAQTKLEVVEATLHHLMNDVGVEGVHGELEDAPPPSADEVAPPPEP
jgi:hypothetical protein